MKLYDEKSINDYLKGFTNLFMCHKTNNKEVIALPGVYNAATFPSNSLYYPIYYSGILNSTLAL